MPTTPVRRRSYGRAAAAQIVAGTRIRLAPRGRGTDPYDRDQGTKEMPERSTTRDLYEASSVRPGL